MLRSKRNQVLYKIFLYCSLAASLILLWTISGKVLINSNYLPVDDFYNYWKAGQTSGGGYFLLTPPWALPIFTFFGVIPYPISRVLWLLISITLIIGSVNLQWTMYDGKPNLRWATWLLALTFGPTISVLEKGQIGSWILFSICLFGILIRDPKKDLLSGAVLLFAAIKPQLVFLFWPILLLWTILERRWKVLVGFGASLIGFSILALTLRPGLINEYYSVLFVQTEAADWATPTLGGYLRLIFGIHLFWLQFVPSVIGAGWVLWYWTRRHKNWNWDEQLPLLMMVSILTSAYAWTYDQVILIPAIIAVISMLIERKDKKALWLMLGALILINLADLFLHRSLDEFWFGWLAPAYGVWYWVGLKDSINKWSQNRRTGEKD